MAHSLKLLSTRGITSVILTLTLVYLFISGNERLDMFITLYMVVLNYMFSDKGDTDK